MTKYTLTKTQRTALNLILERKKQAIFLKVGGGKTLPTLLAIKKFMYDDMWVNKVLILSTIKISESVWHEEASKWDDTKCLKFSICLGNQVERHKSFRKRADVYICNVENTKWLCENIKWDFDMLVVDESTKFKNPTSKRFKAIKKFLPKLKSVVILSGTPKPNTYQDLWSQMFMVDSGERLGRNITTFRRNYFNLGFDGHSYKLKKGMDKIIMNKIKDICYSEKLMDNSIKTNIINIPMTMPEKVRELYEDLKSNFYLKIDDKEVIVKSVSSLLNKLQQLCSGQIYYDEFDKSKILDIHNHRMVKIKKLIEESNDNVLVAYNYKSTQKKLLKEIEGSVDLKSTKDVVKKWNDKEIKVLIAHPYSGGHGLNLQYGGHTIIWSEPTQDLEGFDQLNGRLPRRGQTSTVNIYRPYFKNTVEEYIVKNLKDKSVSQEELMRYLQSTSRTNTTMKV